MAGPAASSEAAVHPDPGGERSDVPKASRHYRMTRPLWNRIAPHEILAVSETDADRFRRVFDQAKVAVMPNMKFETLEFQASQIRDTGKWHV